MFCRKCGNEMPDYATRCDKCGTKVGSNSTAKGGFNKLLFIPIGAGAAAVIALVVALVFLLRPKDDIVQPSDSSVRTSSSNVSQTPVVIDNTPVTLPASTPSSNAVDSNSQPNESEETIPDALSFYVNGVNIPVSEAGYAEDTTGDDVYNRFVIWGENSRYIVMADVIVPESLTEAKVTYTGLVSGTEEYRLDTRLYLYDIENDKGIDNGTGTPDSEFTGQVVKIGSYLHHKSINLFASNDIKDRQTTIPFNISGRFDYLSDYDMLIDIIDHFYDTADNAMNAADDPAQSTVNEVVIAGQSYSLDTEYIDLTGKNVTNADIENLKYLTNLTNIQLANNSRVTDLSALSGLTKLESLWLDDTAISDISPLSGCKNLREMGIKNTKVRDISALSNCTKLSKLIAVNCNISNILPLANCPDMRELWISENPITDFSPLVKLNNLETVGVNNCCEMTWSIMKTLYGLHFTKELNVSGNGLTEEMAIELNNNVYSSSGQLWY